MSGVKTPFGMSASLPGVVLVLANRAAMPVSELVAIPTYAVSNVGSGFVPSIIQIESVVIVISATIASVTTTIVIMRFDVAGIVNVIPSDCRCVLARQR